MKKCVYCGTQLPDSSVIDCCPKCGEKVWGKKMFECIVQKMESENEKDNLSLFKDPTNQQIQQAPSVTWKDVTKGIHKGSRR